MTTRVARTPDVRGDATPLACAMSYALAGWPVFPCRPGGKEPLTAHGFKDASTDPEQVSAWWSRWPDANLATPTGVLFDVLDVDVRVEGTGWPALHRLNAAGLLAGSVGIATTRNGGAHLFYPSSGRATGSLKRHRLDFKATGGYVLLAPSRVPADDGVDGPGLYRWDDLDLTRADAAPLRWDACARLLDPPPILPARSVARCEGRRGAIQSLADWLRGQGEGNRNRALFWAACRALEDGHDDLDELRAAGRVLGLPGVEVNRTLASAKRRIGGAS